MQVSTLTLSILPYKALQNDIRPYMEAASQLKKFLKYHFHLLTQTPLTFPYYTCMKNLHIIIKFFLHLWLTLTDLLLFYAEKQQTASHEMTSRENIIVNKKPHWWVRAFSNSLVKVSSVPETFADVHLDDTF
jgi:hypothetical protein